MTMGFRFWGVHSFALEQARKKKEQEEDAARLLEMFTAPPVVRETPLQATIRNVLRSKRNLTDEKARLEARIAEAQEDLRQVGIALESMDAASEALVFAKVLDKAEIDNLLPAQSPGSADVSLDELERAIRDGN